MGRPGYCLLEQATAALDAKRTAYDTDEVYRAVLSAGESIDTLCRVAHFDPRVATRYFDYPQRDAGGAWLRWLDDSTLIALTSLTAGGAVVNPASIIPYPVNTGPPYTRLELDRSAQSSWSSGNTPQKALAAVGLWGVRDDTVPAGALAAAMSDTTSTTVDVTDGSKVGVLGLLTIGTERVIVEARDWLTSGQTLGTNLAGTENAQLVNLSSGAAFHVGESILIDAEEMLLRAIAGNNGVVSRAVNGTVLASHTAGATIYASRRLTVERGASGTTAATHSLAAAVSRWRAPQLVESLAVAETVTQVAQEEAQYGRTVGSGDNEREAAGKGIEDLRKRVRDAFGRSLTGAA